MIVLVERIPFGTLLFSEVVKNLLPHFFLTASFITVVEIPFSLLCPEPDKIQFTPSYLFLQVHSSNCGCINQKRLHEGLRRNFCVCIDKCLFF